MAAMRTTRDSHGHRLTPAIAREGTGWGVTVWFGGLNGLGTDVQRRVYATRHAARAADISDAGYLTARHV